MCGETLDPGTREGGTGMNSERRILASAMALWRYWRRNSLEQNSTKGSQGG